MTTHIIIRVKRPPDYDDVCAETVAEDFIESAHFGAWEWEAMDDNEEKQS